MPVSAGIAGRGDSENVSRGRSANESPQRGQTIRCPAAAPGRTLMEALQ
jgi:hypothetical protein